MEPLRSPSKESFQGFSASEVRLVKDNLGPGQWLLLGAFVPPLVVDPVVPYPPPPSGGRGAPRGLRVPLANNPQSLPLSEN